MIGTLVTHCGAAPISRAELNAIQPPPGTATWRPVAHGELLSALEQELTRRSLFIQKEAFAVQRNGALLFGVIDLAWRETSEYTAAIGLRTSNDKSFAIQIAVGVRVFVCDNLAFSGDVIALRRKHTARLDLPAEMTKAFDRYQEGMTGLQHGIEQLRHAPLSDSEAKVLIHDVFAKGILPVRFFRAVSASYFHPPAEASDLCHASKWSLHNAVTRQIKQLPPGPAFEATVQLGQMFGLTQAAQA